MHNDNFYIFNLRYVLNRMQNYAHDVIFIDFHIHIHYIPFIIFL